MNRYKIARARSPERLQELLQQDADLLSDFGMTLTAIDGGLSIVPTEVVTNRKRINPWDMLNVSMGLWEWLLPLLEELRVRRIQGSSAESHRGIECISIDSPRVVRDLAAK